MSNFLLNPYILGSGLNANVVSTSGTQSGGTPWTIPAASGRAVDNLLFSVGQFGTNGGATPSEAAPAHHTSRVSQAVVTDVWALAKSRIATLTSDDDLHYTNTPLNGATLYGYQIATNIGSSTVTYSTTAGHNAQTGAPTTCNAANPGLTAPAPGISYLVVIAFDNGSVGGPTVAASGYTLLDSTVLLANNCYGKTFAKSASAGSTSGTTVTSTTVGSPSSMRTMVFEFFVS